MKKFGFVEKKYEFPHIGSIFCFECMRCSVCDKKARGEVRGIIGLQPVCKAHLDMYNKDIAHRPITAWPSEFVDARLKFLYRVRARNMKILAGLRKGPGKLGFIAETLAILGGNFEAASYLNLSEMNRRGQVAGVIQRFEVDLQDCLNQINELEAFKQNPHLFQEVANLNSNSNNVRAHELHDPIQIAKVRYAKGEISKKQFQQIMKDLNSRA
jgi:hypothetical protein